MNMCNMEKAVVVLLLVAATLGLCHCRICYTSNGSNKSPTNNGQEYACRAAAGAALRYCIKFTTERHPNKVFRDCDRIYDKHFGDEFKTEEEICKRFNVTVKGVVDAGILCFCADDRCNDGEVSELDLPQDA